MKRILCAALCAVLLVAGAAVLAAPFAEAFAPGIKTFADVAPVLCLPLAAGFTAQGDFTPDGIFAGTDDPQTRSITLLSGQNLERGAVLGKVTATGKYVLSLSAAVDGSETPATILGEDCDASAGDKVTIAHFGGVFDENALTYGTGHTAASVRDQLRDVGIKLQSSIT